MAKPQFTIEEKVKKFYPIYFYRRHLDIAARDLLGLDLSPHHRIIIRDWGKMKPITLLLSSRGMGKTVLTAMYYVLLAILYPRIKLMVIGGGGFRSAKNLMFECEKVIKCQLSGQRDAFYAKYSLEDPVRVINKDPSQWKVSFSNGSSIFAVPLGLDSDGSIIRGLRAHVLAVDEAFLIPTKFFQTILQPMLNVLYDVTKTKEEQTIKNMSVLTSTIDFSFRDFYSQFEYYMSVIQKGETGNKDELEVQPEDISVFEFNIDDSYVLNGDKREMVWGLDYESIIKKRKLPNTDQDVWNAENKNIAMDISGGYYPFESIERCYNVCLDEKNDIYPEVLAQCSGQCIMGIDTAPTSANTAFVVIKAGALNDKDINIQVCETANMGRPCSLLKNHKYCGHKHYTGVIYAYEENKMSQRDRVKKIYELMDRYNIIGIALDQRGGGHELSDLLKDKQYVSTIIGPEYIPIYDPVKNPDSDGMPILKMYALTQDMNMIMAGYLKALVTNTGILFPKYLRDRPDNPVILEAAGHCETLINQLVRIKAVPSGKGVKFEIEAIDPDSGRRVSANKDLFSALMYSVGYMREAIEQKLYDMKYNPEEPTLPVAFTM